MDNNLPSGNPAGNNEIVIDLMPFRGDEGVKSSVKTT